MNVEQKIFHYTDAGAAISIIEKGQLWATAVAHMNDSAEVEFGLDFVQRLLEREPSLLPSLELGVLRERLTELRRDRGLWEHLFVACASLADDAVSQWVGYGRAGGYALGFTVKVGRPWGVAPPEGWAAGGEMGGDEVLLSQLQEKVLDGVWRPVVYDERCQLNYARDYLPKVASAMKIFSGAAVTRVADSMLLRLAATLKNAAYASEEEVRCIISEEPNRRRVKFRPGGFGVTPYVEISPRGTSGKSVPVALDEVVVGPSAFAPAAKAGISRLLQSQGSPAAAHVRGSGSSYRHP